MKLHYKTPLSDFKKYARKIHAETKQKAIQDARFFAEEGKPDFSDDDITPYVGSLLSAYDHLTAEAESITQAKNNQAQGTIENDEWEKRNTTVDQEIGNLEHDRKRVKHQKDTHATTYSWDRYPLIKAAVYICSGFEALISAKSFQIFGQSVRISYLIAIGFGFIMAYLAEFVAKIIKSSETVQQMKIRIICSVVLLSIFFYGLTLLRYMYLHMTGTLSHEMEVSPVYFVLLNLVFFTVSVSIVYFYMPDKEERLARDKEKKLENEYKTLTKKIDSLKEQKAKDDKQSREILKDRAASIYAEGTLKSWIESLKNETIQEFIAVNIRYRKGKVPNCFKLKNEDANQ